MPELEKKSVAELLAGAYDREVQFQIGKHYFNGTGGVEQDCFEGVEWIRSAAEREYAPAQYFLGRCYLHGKGVYQSAFQALKWFQKAANNRYTDALDYLALCDAAARVAPKDEGMHETQNTTPDKPGTVLAHESQPVKEGVVADAETEAEL